MTLQLGRTSPDISRGAKAAACSGLITRGLVYLVLGWLAAEVAWGHQHPETDQKGALADIASHTGGKILLIIVAAGLAAYALWRLSQAAFGSREDDSGTGARFKALGQAVVYAAACVTAVEVLTGSSRTGQAQEQKSWTARLMHHTGGRWLIGVIGAVVLVIGIAMIVHGVRRQFVSDLHVERMRPSQRRLIVALGCFGNTARGVVIGLAGGLVIDAAVTADPNKSTGLDGALRTLADNSAGPWLLGLAAIGLIAFGLYSIVSAPWTRV